MEDAQQHFAKAKDAFLAYRASLGQKKINDDLPASLETVTEMLKVFILFYFILFINFFLFLFFFLFLSFLKSSFNLILQPIPI